MVIMDSVKSPQNVFFYRINGIDIGIGEERGAITGVFFGHNPPAAFTNGYAKAETPLIKKTAVQIDEYLAGKLKEFSLPLALHGTEFQKAVWQALQAIPYGETRSYKDIAAAIGKPKAVRAVGMANNRNPVVIIVPCHRVIGHDGSLTGYGGGLPLKQRLLELEQCF
ncbi:MAG: methylated-DNA--[protein]-cysteine S-methyltransferase [Treponema sp.]|nr:methylated-DNA--[protein]-cysteine S-methyltransferase [Treponema sp.]